MRITYKGDYALKAVLALSLNYNKEVVNIQAIAKYIDAPIKFLEQVLLELKKGGFVKSKRGKIGGYFLSKPPDSITVGEVIRFIDGPIDPIACVKHGYSGCRDVYKCVFRKIWQEVFLATSNIIDKITFEDLVAEIGIAEQIPAYCI